MKYQMKNISNIPNKIISIINLTRIPNPIQCWSNDQIIHASSRIHYLLDEEFRHLHVVPPLWTLQFDAESLSNVLQYLLSLAQILVHQLP